MNWPIHHQNFSENLLERNYKFCNHAAQTRLNKDHEDPLIFQVAGNQFQNLQKMCLWEPQRIKSRMTTWLTSGNFKAELYAVLGWLVLENTEVRLKLLPVEKIHDLIRSHVSVDR